MRHLKPRCTIREDGKRFNILEIGYDPWNAEHLCNQQLALEDGFNVVEVKQTFQQLSEATSHFEKLLKEKRLRHGDHPVLNWQSRNAIVRHDPMDNIMVDKKNSTSRIDGIAASIMALQRWLANATYDGEITVF